MIPRYLNVRIAEIWRDSNKLHLWQKTELAVIEARCNLGGYPENIITRIKRVLENVPIDIDWWIIRDKEIHHDLNAFLDERLRHLDPKLHQYFHDGMTSYDTEEPALSMMLIDSVEVVEAECDALFDILKLMINKYEFVPMLGRTHGQEAKMQSFGKRVFTWYKKLAIAYDELVMAKKWLYCSKLSGAIGNYQGLDEMEEAAALTVLGLTPFKGATQIMPRQIHQPLANALVMVVGSLAQIAEDIRLAARSSNPIMQEPFGKKQKGSSAMPHKKNTIRCENQIGMWLVAKNFAQMLRDTMITWEERSIEQSSVERIVWPDFFHVIMQSFKNMEKILGKVVGEEGEKKIEKPLKVYPDNMMLEIINSRGCYASEDAKDWLKEYGVAHGLAHEDAYRIVQLAAFNAHQIGLFRQNLRKMQMESHKQVEEFFVKFKEHMAHVDTYDHLADIIANGCLTHTDELDLSEDEVNKWNEILKKIFADKRNFESWKEIFSISYHLRNEAILFEELEQ